ncbi:hypothetical protein NDU88_007330 [Pleurodeles waltl]|uniref:Uncharacterized protein n=1 Tax=Pleurodeles waltl TaxID=8319 RepID=A0AAV7MFU2_PLEWA|nr:hypothetical protein NDU88_007330 [Pleurodeles waltl]
MKSAPDWCALHRASGRVNAVPVVRGVRTRCTCKTVARFRERSEEPHRAESHSVALRPQRGDRSCGHYAVQSPESGPKLWRERSNEGNEDAA